MVCELSAAEKTELESLSQKYTNAYEDLKSYLETLQTEWQDDLDSHSDEWKESSAGEAAQARLDKLEEITNALPFPDEDIVQDLTSP